MVILTREINTKVAWAILGIFISLIVILYAFIYSSTMQSLSDAQQSEKAPIANVRILPKQYVFGDDVWVVIKIDTAVLSDWKIQMRMPYGYVKSTVVLRDSTEDAYYFADLAAVKSSDCRIRYYEQLKATRPGLKVQRYNGSSTKIRVGAKDVLLEDYYNANVKAGSNFVVMPNDVGSLRRLYRVGDYYYYDTSELPDAKLNTTSLQQRNLLCKDVRILDIDEIFISALATLEPTR